MRISTNHPSIDLPLAHSSSHHCIAFRLSKASFGLSRKILHRLVCSHLISFKLDMSGSPFAMVSSSSASDTSKNVSYRDYSMVAPPENHESLLESTKSSTLQTFPSKLHYLLTFADIAGDQLNKVISWQPHGRCELSIASAWAGWHWLVQS